MQRATLSSEVNQWSYNTVKTFSTEQKLVRHVEISIIDKIDCKIMFPVRLNELDGEIRYSMIRHVQASGVEMW